MPGDTIGILPQNSEINLNKIIEYSPALKSKFNHKLQLSLSAESSAMKKITKMPIYLPTQHTSLSQVFRECVDLHAFPKKSFLWAFFQYNCLTNADERRYVEILASREGSALYTSEILQKQTTFYILLERLTSWHFDHRNIGVLLEHLPRLMPRPYSISNSILSTELLDEYNRKSTILKIIFSLNDPPGITTNMLQKLIFKYEVENTLELSTKELIVNLYARQSNRFQLTDDDLNRPLLMIAIGTGVAPFIGFLEHLREQKKRTKMATKSFTWLLFGCKRRNKQICAKQIKDFVADGTLSRFTECFSRESNSVKYVQDIIKMNPKEIIDLLIKTEEDQVQPKIFICGNKKMAIDVRAAIEEALVTVGDCNPIEDAKQIVNELVKNGRYIEDIWI